MGQILKFQSHPPIEVAEIRSVVSCVPEKETSTKPLEKEPQVTASSEPVTPGVEPQCHNLPSFGNNATAPL